MLFMYDINKCQKVSLPQGAIYLGPSDENKSVGYLELSPHTPLNLHNRPATEKLTQVREASNMVVFNNDKGETIILQVGASITINPTVWHIHANP